jgi:pseudouridine synthase
VLDGVRTAPARIENVRRSPAGTSFTIVLREGRNRQVRRMVEGVGHHVKYLRRDRVAPVTLGGLRPGQCRYLTSLQMKMLRRAK